MQAAILDLPSVTKDGVLFHITFDIFLDLTTLIDYFILKKGWLHEDNGHKRI